MRWHFYKTGRNKATRSTAFKDFAVYTTGPWLHPLAPWKCRSGQASNGRSVYPMDGNDKYGDCTIAGFDHFARGRASSTRSRTVRRLYRFSPRSTSALTGGQDSGLNEEFVLKTAYEKGIFGTKIAAFAPVSTTNLLQWHQAISMYGGLYLGIQCPESAQVQFSKAKHGPTRVNRLKTVTASWLSVTAPTVACTALPGAASLS